MRCFFSASLFVFLFSVVSCAQAEEMNWSSWNAQVVSLYKQAQYAKAADIGQEAVKSAEASFGPDHPKVAVSLNNLAAAYLSMGEYNKAEPLFKRALSIDEKIFGSNHPNVAADRANLDELYKVKPQMKTSQVSSGGSSMLISEDKSAEKKSAPKPAVTPADKTVVRWDAPYEEWKNAGYADKEQARERASSSNLDGLSKRFKGSLAVENGYRADELSWSIAGTIGGNNPNILSELTWSNLESYHIRGEGVFEAKKIFYLRGAYDYGWIFDGENQDSDYNADDRRAEFSRSNNKSKEGKLQDATLGIGYPFNPVGGGSEYDLRFIPLVGYSYHQQDLRITDGSQTIPPTGPFYGLDSEYKAYWRGPWIGFDLEIKPRKKWKVFGSFEYHWYRYRGEARWNLRKDFQQPLSFRHDTTGQGVYGSAGLAYLASKHWSFYLKAEAIDFSTESGLDKVYAIITGGNQTTSDTQLNVVNWESWAVNAGAKYEF